MPAGKTVMSGNNEKLSLGLFPIMPYRCRSCWDYKMHSRPLAEHRTMYLNMQHK